MRRPHLGMLFALACVPILAITALASATPKVGEHDNGLSITDERYLHVYVDCWDAFKAQCGRNIVDDGLRSGNPPSNGRVQRSIDTMDGWLHPPEPEPVASSTYSSGVAPAPVTTTVAPSSGDTGGYAIPSYIVECESGGDYGAQNASGAYGAYQIMPGTAAGYGCDLSTPAGQDSCAAEIYAAEGASPWACG